MGCGNSRNKSTIEEALASSQKSLGFYRHQITEIDFLFRKFSFQRKISQRQLDLIASKLNLEIRTVSSIFLFQTEYFERDKGYQLEDWLILGILLGSGHLSTKSSLLFEIYDLQSQNYISKSSLVTLLSKLIDFSVIILPSIFAPSQSQDIQQIQIEKYISSILYQKQHWISEILKKFSEPIKKSKFIEVFTRGSERNLLRPQGIREHLSEFIQTNINIPHNIH